MVARKIEALEISRLVWLFIFVTLISAIAIYWLSPGGNGITPTTDASKTISFFDALYFSVVTISSLGYGDYRPVGYGRLVAVTEVVLGLVLIAIIVSKLASDRTATYVRLLYTSDSERRLKEFKVDIQNRIASLRMAQRDHNHEVKIAEIRSLGLITVNLAKYYQYQVRVGALGEDWARKNSLQVVQAITMAGEQIGLTGKTALVTAAERQQIDVAFRHMEKAVDTISNSYSAEEFVASRQQLQRIIASYRRYIVEGRTRSAYSEVTPYILAQVKSALPKKPWPKNVHKEIATKLRISNKLAHKAISSLEEQVMHTSEGISTS